jgi:hypothetical protein
VTADVHIWWRVTGVDQSVLAFLQAHPPRGSRLETKGSASGPTGVSEQLGFEWRPIPGVLGSRELHVTVTALPGGFTGVLAQAESTWIVARPRSERIPATTSEIDVTSSKLGGPVAVSRSVTDPAQVHQIVSLLNAMPVTQPGIFSCPALIGAGAHVIDLKFRAGAGGPVLAEATYTNFSSTPVASGPCTPVQLTLGGRRQHPLIGGDLVERLQRILGVRLVGRS